MKIKLKLIFIVLSLVYLSAEVSFFVTPSLAEEAPPTIPTIVANGWRSPLSHDPQLSVFLYNPPVDEVANPDLGQSICSVQTSLTFPKDLIEINSESYPIPFEYSNDAGTIDFNDTFDSCSTEIGIELFVAKFIAKSAGSGTIYFTTHVVTGGEGGDTVLSSGVYQDVQFEIINDSEFYSDPEPIEGLTNPAAIWRPSSSSTTTIPGTTQGTKSSSGTTVAKTENSAFKTPTLTKLEFGPDSVLDKENSRSKGAIFTGTAEPNHKINILVNSQETFLDTNSGADGIWTKTITDWIEDGTHKITVWSEKDNETSPKFTSDFVISSYGKDQIAIGTTFPEKNIETPPSTPKKESGLESLIKNKFFWVYTGIGFIVIALSIFLIIRSRRKNNFSVNMNSGTNATPLDQNFLPPQTTATTPTNPSLPPIQSPEDLNKPIDLT